MTTIVNARPYIVGLTGGIGSGKTTVSQMFAALGVDVIDADDISREIVTPGSAALASIIERFGPELQNADGSLHRPRLRNLIFHDAAAKAWLEALLHPLIRSAILDRIANAECQWLLLSAPLLLESKAYDFVDRVLVVDTSEHTQVNRVTQRDNSSTGDVIRIMANQLPRAQRLAQADDIIENSGSLDALKKQVALLAAKYQEASVTGIKQVNCPTCQKIVAWAEAEIYRPFCSKKCQLIDFGEWASERHSIPAEDPPDEFEDESPNAEHH